MSKIFNKKFLLGALMLLAFVVSSTSVEAMITSTLKQGSKGAQVAELQSGLGLSADGSFGPKTKAAVKAWQLANGLVADGVFGPASRAAWANSTAAGTGTPGMTYPAGCTSNAGFSSTTGMPCASAMSYPAGCMSNSGFSSTTGASCATGMTTTFPDGCSSAVGFSSTTGTPCNGTGGAAQGNGPVTVMLASTNPASGVIISGQANAKLMEITFTGTGTVNSLTLTRGGVSTSSTLSNVYLYDGATRITDGYTFNNTGVMTMNNLGIVVNGSKTISVRADVTSSAINTSASGQTVSIWVTGMMVAGQTSSTTVSVGSNMFSVANGSGVLATANLTTTAPSPAATSINAGAVNQTLWSNSVSVGLHAANLVGLTVKQIGSAPANTLANVALYVDGVNVGTAAVNANMQFVFTLANPLALSTGSHFLEVRGDVVGGAYRNFYMSVEKSSDIMIVDPQTSNVGVAVTYLSNTLNNVNGGLVTVNNGTLTINQDLAFNNTTTLVGGATNVKLGSWKFTAYGEDVKVNSLSFTPTITGTCTTLANVGLYVNGGQVGSNVTATTATPISFSSLGSNLTVYVGTPAVVDLRGDVVNSSGTTCTTGTVKFDLIAGSSNAQGMSSSQLTSTSSSGGQTLTIGNNVTFGATAGFSTSTKAPNSVGVKIGSFSIAAGSAESLTVNSISVTLPSGASNTMQPQNQLTNLTVKDGSALVGTPIGNPVLTTSNSFSTNIVVPQGTTKVFDVYADFGSSAGSACVGGCTVNPSVAITYRGNTSNLSATTSTVVGSTTTAGVATIVAGGVTVNTGLSLSSRNVVTSGNFPIATYNFKTNNSVGGAVIKDVTFTVPSPSPVTTITMNGKTASVVGTTATIYNVDVVVPASADGVNVPVTVGLVCTGMANGCAANSPVTVNLLASTVTYNDGSTIQTITPTVLTATTVNHYVYASIPSFSIDTAQKTGLVLGAENKIGEVTVSADAAGQIKVNQITFSVSTSGITTPTSTAPRLADGNTTVSGATCTPAASTAAPLSIVCTLGTSPSGFTIAAGTSKTFSLYTTVGGSPTASTTQTVSTSVSAASWDDSIGGAVNQPITNVYNFPTGSYSIRQ